MISREFIYEFSNFDDISTRENDKKSCAHDICRREMGVWCREKDFPNSKISFKYCKNDYNHSALEVSSRARCGYQDIMLFDYKKDAKTLSSKMS